MARSVHDIEIEFKAAAERHGRARANYRNAIIADQLDHTPSTELRILRAGDEVTKWHDTVERLLDERNNLTRPGTVDHDA